MLFKRYCFFLLLKLKHDVTILLRYNLLLQICSFFNGGVGSGGGGILFALFLAVLVKFVLL